MSLRTSRIGLIPCECLIVFPFLEEVKGIRKGIFSRMRGTRVSSRIIVEEKRKKKMCKLYEREREKVKGTIDLHFCWVRAKRRVGH